jgi:hypothetical protein
MKYASWVALPAIVALGVSCSTTPASPTSPTASEHSAAANADGSTLKMTKPGIVAPFDSEKLDSRRPTFIWQNATGTNVATGKAYELELWDAQKVIYTMIVGETPNQGQHAYPTDLAYATPYSWRIRAALDLERGPWSDWGNFVTMDAPIQAVAPPSGGSASGPVGPPRSIGLNEAYNIIISIHNTLRVDLGGRSSRDYRIAFLNAAVAAIHYGHGRFNPQGPDSNWCVKDAGGGRPQSDDVLVRCNSREAWDLIVGAGGNGYSWHLDYLGTLPSIQNVYPPPRSSLGFLGQ